MMAELVKSPASPLEHEALGRQLWRAADILRGAVDPSAYRHYILSLLFLKRACDMAQEGTSYLPKTDLWPSLLARKDDVGMAIDGALFALESSDDQLQGLFEGVRFHQPDRFSNELLGQLLLIFDGLELRQQVTSPSILGDAYEYLLSRFASDAGRKGGEFYTPKGIVQLLVALLAPIAGQRIYDPACGAGGLLLGCRSYSDAGPQLKLFGQEKNPTTFAMARLALLLHGADASHIALGDTLVKPAHADGEGGLESFDRIVANPPFSLKNWGHQQWKAGDIYERDRWGIPPKSYGDWAFITHMLTSLSPGGRMAVVVPHGVLFRGGTEANIRQNVIEEDLIEAVVGLAPNLFYGTGIPTAILVFSREKSRRGRGHILMINGHERYQSGRVKNWLGTGEIHHLSALVSQLQEEAGLSALVPVEAVRENDYNLNITRYIDRNPVREALDLETEIQALKIASQRRQVAEDAFFNTFS